MIKTKNPGIREAIKELKVMSLGKRMRMIYEEYLQEERDRRWLEKCEREEKEEREVAFEAKLEAMRQAKEREMQEAREHGICAMILDNLEEGIPEDRICEKLCRRFELSREQAEGYVTKYKE